MTRRLGILLGEGAHASAQSYLMTYGCSGMSFGVPEPAVLEGYEEVLIAWAGGDHSALSDPLLGYAAVQDIPTVMREGWDARYGGWCRETAPSPVWKLVGWVLVTTAQFKRMLEVAWQDNVALIDRVPAALAGADVRPWFLEDPEHLWRP